VSGAPFLPALAALGSAATWALGSHLFRRALERRVAGTAPTPAAANLFKNALAFALFAALLPLLAGELPPRERWGALALSGVFGFALGDTLYFAALPRCGVQVAAMVGLVHVPAAVVLGWLVHGERLPASALLGGLAILLGVALVVSESPRAGARDPRDVRAGVALAAAGAIAQAAGVVVGHGAMQGIEILGGTLARMSGGLAGAFVLAALAGLAPALRGAPTRFAPELSDLVRPWFDRGARSGLLPAALFGSVMGLPLFHLGLRGLPSGVAAVLFATTPLFTLPLGAALGERHGARAVAGALLGFAGVAGVVAAVS
jgi:drug/metabolite transporter (DMT)-like permease